MGRITPDVGATDLSMCLAPYPNFYIAIASILFEFFWIFVYIFNDRYHWLAFSRGKYYDNNWKKGLKLVREKCRNMCFEAIKFPQERQEGQQKVIALNLCLRILEKFYNRITDLKIILKLIVFFLLSIILTPIGAALMTLGILFSIMYQTLIIWRGFYTTVELYIKILTEIIANIEKVFSPLSFLLYPVKYLLEVLSKIKIDLSAVNITCEGKYFYYS